MANPSVKPIKVLSDLVSKKQTETKNGLTVSGSIKDSCDVGLHVENHVFFDKDLYVADKTYAVGFSQVGALDVNGLLQVSGHLLVTGSFELSSSSDFISIPQVSRNTEGMYFVDNAIHALDERAYTFRTTYNANKIRFDAFPNADGAVERSSHYDWADAGFISVDVMSYRYTDNSWSNDLISVKLVSDASNKVKFIITTPKLGDSGVHPQDFIRVIATRQTDIT